MRSHCASKRATRVLTFHLFTAMSSSWRVLSLANAGPLERLCRAPLSVSTSILQGRQAGRYGRRRKRVIRRPPAWTPVKPTDVNYDSEWSSVFHAPRPFDPYHIPLPIRMGRAEPGSVPPPALGNLELMKIPNFFHLTPPAIEKHCQALKPLCTPWPKKLPNLPVKIETRNYVFPGPSLRHSGARKVVLTVELSALTLSERARNKLIELAGSCYCEKTDTLRLVGKRCPTRKQNREYVTYLLKVLYLEANKVEPWEELDLDQKTQ